MSRLVMYDPLLILRQARDLLNHKTWTQGALARAADGRLVGPNSKDAVCWSAEGAIRRFSNDSIGSAILSIIAVELTIEKLHPEFAKVRLGTWNDVPGRTVKEVKDMLLASIRRTAASENLIREKKIR